MDLKNLRRLDLDLPAIINLSGLDSIIQAVGQDKVIEAIERENIFETLFPNLTKEQIEKLIKQNGGK